MFTESFKNFVAQQRIRQASTLPWVFYGWTAGIAVSLCIIGYILSVLYKEVYITLQTTESTVVNQSSLRPISINFALFQKTKHLWDAKKNLPLKKIPSNNPFSQPAE
jgi:D-alanyl-lipoteichoic acid acyltransferase DltB (MBOAT superfamily)